MSERVLSESEVEHFVRRGFVRVRGCFGRELAHEWTTDACERLYCSLDDSSTWSVGRIRSPESLRVSFESIAPKAWQAACELVGGADRVLSPCTWGNDFTINFGHKGDLAWHPPSRIVRDYQIWHKDGDFFRHFLDSPEQGLLVIAIFSDIQQRGGATALACDSVPRIASFLAEHPEGVLPRGFPEKEIVARCDDFVEATGDAGDVYLMHPFMLHTWSVNESGKARFIINPPVTLRDPMCFSRPSAADHSPVERTVLRALGQERYEFVPTAPREAIVPERVARDKKLWEERARSGDVTARR
ncbi:MAG TPA: hypothetical protein VEK07_14490 [Polyangiaceae bacterium]|nr:hypothetical protein [Polyangiaceae bacterium]